MTAAEADAPPLDGDDDLLDSPSEDADSDSRSQSGSGSGSEVSGSDYFIAYGSESEGSSDGSAEWTERERLVHWWCRKQLQRCLKNLRTLPEAKIFLEPLPWERLGLTDYPEVVTEPMDLKTVGQRLENGEYEDTDGLTNPDDFWEDVALIWENCKMYYENDEAEEPVRMAMEMQVDAEAMEAEFFDELRRFDQSLVGVNSRVANMTAVADVAKAQMNDRLAETTHKAQAALANVSKWFTAVSKSDKKEPVAPKLPAEPQRVELRVSRDFAVGRGRCLVTLPAGVPGRASDQDVLAEAFTQCMGEELDVEDELVQVDWDAVFAMPTDIKAADWTELLVEFSVRLDTSEDTAEVVDGFAPVAAAGRMKKVLSERCGCSNVTFEPMVLQKNSRRPLRDHYFEMLVKLCKYGEDQAEQDLQDIDDELCEALQRLLPLIKEVDIEDRYDLPTFPDSSKKVPLEKIRRPKISSTKRHRSTVSSVASRASSRAGSDGEEDGVPSRPSSRASRSSRVSVSSAGRASRVSLKEVSRKIIEKSKRKSADSNAPASAEAALDFGCSSPSENEDVGPDFDHLASIVKKRSGDSPKASSPRSPRSPRSRVSQSRLSRTADAFGDADGGGGGEVDI